MPDSAFDSMGSIPPWQRRPFSVLKQTFAILGFLLCLIGAIVSGFVFIFSLPLFTRRTFQIEPSLISGIIFVATVVGIVMLHPYTKGANFEPQGPPVEPHSAAEPIEVYFHEDAIRCSFSGKGRIRFRPDSLACEGPRTPQAGIWLLYIPLVFVSGLIGPLIAKYLFTSKALVILPYEQITSVRVSFRTLEFSTGTLPSHIHLTVSTADGERLYRELARYIPNAVSGYERWLN